MSMFSASEKETETGGLEFRRDLLTLEIFQTEGEQSTRGASVAKATGSYLEHIKYESDEEAIWSINSDINRMEWVNEIDPKLILPSDSSHRPDAAHILAEEWDEAEASKHEQEDL